MPRYIFSGVTQTFIGAKKIFLTPHTQAVCNTWTVPAGVTCLTFELWGAGGAGSPVCCCTCYGGMPGDGGAYSMKTLSVTPGTVYTYVVGCGGCGSSSWYQSNACGCRGSDTYITGTGLSNFCAMGGAGGLWCNQTPCNCALQNIGIVGYGGDLNLPGYNGRRTVCCFSGSCFLNITGSAPLGGGLHAVGHTGQQTTYISCGVHGNYPGGGGQSKPMFSPGWCDCCEGCNGGGADGLIIITL